MCSEGYIQYILSVDGMRLMGWNGIWWDSYLDTRAAMLVEWLIGDTDLDSNSDLDLDIDNSRAES